MAQSLTPGHASDEDLALYALHRDDVDAATATHIAQCSLCQQEAAKFGGFLQQIDAHLYRVTCPSVETLADYAARALSLKDQQAIEDHLRGCERCAEEVRATQDFFERTDSDLATWSAHSPFQAPAAGQEPGALPHLIAQLLPASLKFNPAFPLLGNPEEQGAFQVFRANGVTISVRQEPTPDGRVVMGAIQQDAEAAPGEDALFARLIWEGETSAGGAPEQPAPQSVIVRGTFEFDHAQPGRYHIEVYFPTLVVVVGPITVEVL